MQGALVWSLVGELRSHMLSGAAKNKKIGEICFRKITVAAECKMIWMGVTGSKGASQRPWASSTGEMVLFRAEAAATWMDTGHGLEGHLLQRPWELMKCGQGWEERKTVQVTREGSHAAKQRGWKKKLLMGWKKWIWLWVCWIWSGVLSWRFLKEKLLMQRVRAGREMLWVQRNLKRFKQLRDLLCLDFDMWFFLFFFCFDLFMCHSFPTPRFWLCPARAGGPQVRIHHHGEGNEPWLTAFVLV